MPLLRALQDVGSLTPPPAYSNPGPHASTRLIDIYSIVGAMFCIASLLAAAAVIWKLARRPMLLSTSGRSVTQGPHSMKRFMDSVVLVMSVIDVVFAAVLVTTLIVTWRLWYFQGVQNHWVWWAFAQFCWLPQFYHCYIASVCFNWVVRKHSVARLQRAFRPSLVGIVLAVLLQTTLALSLNGWDTRTGESFTLAKTIAYIEYLAVHVCTQMTLLWFYIRSCWSLVGHLRGGQRVNKPYRKIVWRFMKMCAMSLIVWSFWTAVMFMWYTVFTTQLVVIMFLTLPVWIYPFLDAMLMGNIFELYRRGPSSEEHRQRGPVTVASTSVKCLESRAGAWRASQEGLGHSSYAFRGKIRREETSASERGASTATIFTSTLNLGGVKDIAHLGGSLEEWLPPGYDVYCIGVQECIILDDLRQALHEHLGGPSEYTMFQADVGAATMLYGTIALTAFARASDVQRGAFSAIDALTSRVKNGVNLVVTKTANKGMVGLAFRYHDSTLAFVTAHFASDSGGKTRLKRRNGDAYVLLRALNLTDTEEGFDFHLEHHHTFVMGDLNYRMKTDAASMITRIAAAATRAKGILNDGFSQTSDAFQPSMQGLGFLGEEEDRDGRNVRFGFPSFDEKMEDAPSSHRDLASTPAPQEEAGVEWREEGQMSWVREKYLRLYPRGAPGDGGSRSPLGLVLRRRWSSGLSVLSMQPEGSVERQGSCQFPQEVERDEDILTDSDEEEDSGDEWEEKEDEAGAGEAEVEVPEQEEEQEKMEEEEEVEEVEEDEEEEEVGDTVEDEGWDAEETKEERATTDTTKTNQSHDGLSQRSRHWLTLRNSLRGIKASDKSPLASKASPQDFPASPSRRAILGRRFGWPGRKRGAARGRSHHRLRRREREEDGREGGR
ncbi:type i inositol polyphosphate, partial [Nannochloropsis gaditana]